MSLIVVIGGSFIFLCSFFMDFILVVLLCRLAGLKVKMVKKIISGIFLAATGVVIAKYTTGLFMHFLCGISLFVGLCIADIRLKKAEYFISWYMMAFLISGVWRYVIAELNLTMFIIMSVLTYVTGRTLIWLRRRWSIFDKRLIFEIEVVAGGKTIKGLARYDSANMLTEPISGCMVVVCGKNESLKYKNLDEIPERIIPYNTIGGKGLLVGKCVESITVNYGKYKKDFDNCYIAMAEREISAKGTYDYLLNYKMMGENGK